MSSLSGKVIAQTYKDILQMSGGLNEGITNSLKTLEDGGGDTSPIQISTDEVKIANTLFNASKISNWTGSALDIMSTVNFLGAGPNVITASTNFSDTINVAGLATLGLVSAGSATLSGTLTVSGHLTGSTGVLSGNFESYDLKANNNLVVTGATNLNGTVSCATSLNVGSSIIAGGLIQGGAVTVQGVLTTIGDSDLQSNVDVGGILTVTGGLSTVTNLDVTGDSIFTGNVTLNSNIYAYGEFATGLVPNVSTINLGTALKPWYYLFSDNIDNASNITSGGFLDIGGTLEVDGKVTFSSTGASAYDLQVDGDMNLDGEFTMGTSFVNIDASGNANFTGYGTFGAYIQVGTYATIGGYLTVTGAITGLSTLSISSTGLFGSDLNVGGDLTAVGDIETTAGNLIIDGTSDFNDSADFQGEVVLQTGFRPSTAGGSSGLGTQYVGTMGHPFNEMNVGDIYIGSAAPNTIQTNSGDLKLMSTTGTVEVTTNLNLSSAAGQHTINGKWIGSHIPYNDGTYDLGSSLAYWKNLYIGNVVSPLKFGCVPTPKISTTSSLDLICTNLSFAVNTAIFRTDNINSQANSITWDIRTANYTQAIAFRFIDSTAGTSYIGIDTLTKAVNIDTDENITGTVTHDGKYDIDGDIQMQNLHKIQFTNSGVNSYITSDGAGSAFYMSTNGTLSAVGTLLLSAPATTASGSLNVQGATDLDTTLNVDGVSEFQSHTIHNNHIYFPNNQKSILWTDGAYGAWIKADTIQATPELGGEMEIFHTHLINHTAPKAHFNDPDLWGTPNLVDQFCIRGKTKEGSAVIAGGPDGSFQHLSFQGDTDSWQRYSLMGCTREEADASAGGSYLYD